MALAMQQARTKAAALLDLFDRVVLVHHADEEQELSCRCSAAAATRARRRRSRRWWTG
jgi:hypothetical protein